jgi:hypothetical protein
MKTFGPLDRSTRVVKLMIFVRNLLAIIYLYVAVEEDTGYR